jgi:hypothetical protein
MQTSQPASNGEKHTLDWLEKYFTLWLNQLEKSSERSLLIFTEDMHRRLDILNNEDLTRKELIARCITRDEYAIRHEQLVILNDELRRSISDLQLTRARTEGQSSRATLLAWLAVTISVILGIVDIVLRVIGK